MAGLITTAEPRVLPTGATVLVETDSGSFLLQLGNGPAQIADGFGGWEVVDRFDDVALTKWMGQAPLRMNIPIMLDGLASNENVQRELDRILKLGRTRDADEAPSPFKVTGPVPFSGERWVMESTPDFDEAVRSHSGKLVRQHLTLHLLQYVRGDRVKIKRRKGNRGDTYTSKPGDTILKIVARFHPGASGSKLRDYAHDVADANKIRDIRKRLDPGTKIKLT